MSEKPNAPRAGQILLVEDSPTQAFRVRLVLESANFEVHVCQTGAQALEYLTNGQPDLILLDLNLPGMAGQEVATRLKTTPALSSIPIVFLTAEFRDPRDIVRGLEIGAEDYLVKPVDDGVLIARICATLRATQTQRELGRLVRHLLTTIQQVGAQLAGQLKIDALMSSVVNLIYSNFAFTGVHVWLLENDELRLSAAAGQFAGQFGALAPVVPLSQSNHLVDCFKHNRQTGVQSWQAHAAGSLILAGYAALETPLFADGQVRGVLDIIQPADRPLGIDDALAQQALADLLGVAMQNAYLFQKLEDLAAHDPLTGLLNRRAILEQLDLEWLRHKRHARSLTIMMIDIDYFKQINDQFGHPTGDLVLKSFSRLARASLRDIDGIGRIGGDEFLIILPETNPQDALRVAERLCLGSTQLRVQSASEAPFVSISLGLVSWPESEAASPQELISFADDALYQAKSAGRNQVGLHTGRRAEAHAE